MDWSRAKSVLIGIFLALNAFLFVYIRVFCLQPAVSADTLDNTIKILNSRGIKVNCEIPATDFKYTSLEFDSNDYSRVEAAEKLLGTKILKEQIKNDQQLEHMGKIIKFKPNNELVYLNVDPQGKVDLQDNRQIEKCARDFLKSLDLPVKEYATDRRIKYDDSVKIRFYEKYKGFIVYDNWFEITVSEKGVTYMKYKYIKVRDVVSESGKSTVPIHSVLLRHFNEEGQVITSIQQGFKKPVEKEQVFIWYSEPYWKVRLENGQDRFFNALTGDEEIISEPA